MIAYYGNQTVQNEGGGIHFSGCNAMVHQAVFLADRVQQQGVFRRPCIAARDTVRAASADGTAGVEPVQPWIECAAICTAAVSTRNRQVGLGTLHRGVANCNFASVAASA